VPDQRIQPGLPGDDRAVDVVQVNYRAHHSQHDHPGVCKLHLRLYLDGYPAVLIWSAGRAQDYGLGPHRPSY